jgi:hypothetical protein
MLVREEGGGRRRKEGGEGSKEEGGGGRREEETQTAEAGLYPVGAMVCLIMAFESQKGNRFLSA